MPPFKRLPKSQVAATEQGLAPMTQFFKPKIKPGRPSRTSSKAGRKAAPKDPAAAPAAKLPAAAAAAASAEQPKAKKQKVSRQNWSKGDGLKRVENEKLRVSYIIRNSTNPGPEWKRRPMGRRTHQIAILRPLLACNRGGISRQKWSQKCDSSSGRPQIGVFYKSGYFPNL